MQLCEFVDTGGTKCLKKEEGGENMQTFAQEATGFSSYLGNWSEVLSLGTNAPGPTYIQ